MGSIWGAFVKTMLIGVFAVGVIPRVQAQWSASIHELEQQAAKASTVHSQLDELLGRSVEPIPASSPSAGINSNAAPLPVANLPDLGRLVSRF